MFEESQNQMVRAVKTYFDFLVDEHGFKGPLLWNYGHEMEYSFVKGDIVFNLGFDGVYYASIVKLERIFPTLESGEQNLFKIDYQEICSY
jgi:hypothetical protein